MAGSPFRAHAADLAAVLGLYFTSLPAHASPSAGLAKLRVLHCGTDRRVGCFELVPRAEDDELRAGIGCRHVAGNHVESVAGTVALRAVAVVATHVAAQHVAPVRALAVTAGQC